MQVLTFLILVWGVIHAADLPGFPWQVRLAAMNATVRIVNKTQAKEGSGVILGRKGAFVYILTAAHEVSKTDNLEVATFSTASYPKPAQVYRFAIVIAMTADVRDLAVIRVTTDDPLPGSLPLCPERQIPGVKGFKALSVGCTSGGAPTLQIDTVVGKTLVRRPNAAGEALFWELDRGQLPGRSGGPLVSKEGFLLGVGSGVSSGKGYFCHVEEIRRFLDQNSLGWLK